jgi:hypothetical protein
VTPNERLNIFGKAEYDLTDTQVSWSPEGLNDGAWTFTLGSGTHWIFAAMITLLMPSVLAALEGSTIFAFFAAMMVLQLLFVVFLMPETKGRTLESLAEGLSRHEHARDGNRG